MSTQQEKKKTVENGPPHSTHTLRNMEVIVDANSRWGQWEQEARHVCRCVRTQVLQMQLCPKAQAVHTTHKRLIATLVADDEWVHRE